MSRAVAGRHVVVVGGGISGLAAAHRLREADPTLRVTVLEGSSRVGGKLAVSEVAGVPVDTGAESMLARRPEGVDLARSAGLGVDLVSPTTATAAIYSRGRLRPLPRGTVMGVPRDSSRLGALLTPAERARVRLDSLLPGLPLRGDVAVGRLVGQRMGQAVVDRLVEPLLGGVYAGRADRLSLAMTVPQLYAPLAEVRTLRAAARAAQPDARTAAPVFAGLRGGVGRLPVAVAESSGAEVRTGVTVRGLGRTAGGWWLETGSVAAPERVEADAVVLAVPARPAARLLAALAPHAAAQLGGLEYASVGLVTLAYPARDLCRPLRGSGVLVPPVEGRLVKAVTYATSKWRWLREASGELVVVRGSVGRFGETADLQRDDADLAAAVAADLHELLGLPVRPVEQRVTRWGGSLPQYAPGHRDLVDRVRAATEALPGLVVCGAAYDGVGIPACIASGRAAADRVVRGLGGGGKMGA